MEKQRPGFVAKAFETHPQTPDRIRKTQQEIDTLLPARAQYMVDTSEFEEVKARLTAVENRHKLNGGQSDRPVLRRRGTAPGSEVEDGKQKSDDERPTLKRRSSQF